MTSSTAERVVGQYKPFLLGPNEYNRVVEEEGSEDYPKAKYVNYLPRWDPTQKYPPLEPYEFRDRGQGADQTFADLLNPLSKITHLTPKSGSEVLGVQLSSLSEKAKDQLALLVAQRKVVVFRDQDFADLPIQEAVDYCRYFGRLNIHPTTGSPEGFPEVHLAHRGAGDETLTRVFQKRATSIAWHADTTFERQPAGTVFTYILEMPEVGGDTLFSDQVQALAQLSPAFQERLHGLKGVHSGIQLVESSRVLV